MATKSKAPKPNTKKRKAGDDVDCPDSNPAKQSKILSFFTPRVELNSTCGTDPTTSVASLSNEQHNVLHMVVEEGKSVFFTGSAGQVQSLEMRITVLNILTKGRASHSFYAPSSPGYVKSIANNQLL